MTYRKLIALGCALVLTLCGMAVAQQQGIGWHFDMMRNRSYGPSGFSGFVTAWVVTNGGTLGIPMASGGAYNYIIDWGDGTSNSVITAYNDPDASHTYASGDSNRIVTMRGTNSFLYINNSAVRTSFRGVVNWSPLVVYSMANAFFGCSSATSFANNIDASYANVSSLGTTWSGCSSIRDGFPDVAAITNNNSLLSTWNNCSGNTNRFPDVNHMVGVTVMSTTWGSCSGIRNGFPEVNMLTNVTTILDAWNGCRGNTNAFPSVSNMWKLTTMNGAWSGCTSSYFSVQSVLGDCLWITGQLKNVGSTFNGNIRMTGYGMPLVTAITNSPGYPTGYTITDCFQNCTNLSDWADIPAAFK